MMILYATLRELPPHARRIRKSHSLRSGLKGTTSACAENTPHAVSSQTPHPNYLRMRGEYNPMMILYATLRELPPHARRILAPGAVKIVGNGTTSACAENTSVRNPRNGGQWNYLRMRGEYLLLSASHSLHPELPPHARRIRLSEIPETAVNGTTSACAENTIR